MPQQDKNRWTTKVRLPLLNKENSERFMEMSYVVARLYGVTKYAEWHSEPLGDNYYELIAEYEIKPFVPVKKKAIKIKIKKH